MANIDLIWKFIETFFPGFGAKKALIETGAAKASNLQQTLSNFHPTLGSENLFALLVLVIILLFALSLGRTRILISLLSIYIAFTLQAIFPYFGQVRDFITFTNDLPTIRIFTFLILYAITLLLLNRSILKRRFNLGEAAFFSVVFMGFIQLALLVSIVLNLAPSFYGLDTKIPSSILPYLGTQKSLFFWSLAPLVILLFSRKSHE